MLTENLFGILEDKAREFIGLSFDARSLQRARTDPECALALGLPTNVNCNIACTFCFTDTHHNKGPQLSLEERLDLLRAASDLGVRTIITGGSGEPFSDRGFPRMLETAIGLGLDYVVFTNLTLIDAQRARWLRDLRRVGIFGSVHSLDAPTYERLTTVPGSFARMMRGAERLLEAGFSTRDFAITSVLGRPNVHELESLIVHWAARELLVYPEYLNITGAAERHRDELYLPYEEYLAALAAVRARRPGYSAEAPLVTPEKKCFTGEYALIVGINGQVKTCFDPGPKGELGSIREMTLRQAVAKKAENRSFCKGYDTCLGRNLFLTDAQRAARAAPANA